MICTLIVCRLTKREGESTNSPSQLCFESISNYIVAPNEPSLDMVSAETLICLQRLLL